MVQIGQIVVDWCQLRLALDIQLSVEKQVKRRVRFSPPEGSLLISEVTLELGTRGVEQGEEELRDRTTINHRVRFAPSYLSLYFHFILYRFIFIFALRLCLCGQLLMLCLLSMCHGLIVLVLQFNLFISICYMIIVDTFHITSHLIGCLIQKF